MSSCGKVVECRPCEVDESWSGDRDRGFRRAVRG